MDPGTGTSSGLNSETGALSGVNLGSGALLGLNLELHLSKL